MNTARQTMAPWAIGLDSDNERVQIITADGGHLCYVEQDPLLPFARLIAAAPDLATELAALVAHVEGINRAFFVEGTPKALKAAMADQRERLQAARAAIAKARQP